MESIFTFDKFVLRVENLEKGPILFIRPETPAWARRAICNHYHPRLIISQMSTGQVTMEPFDLLEGGTVQCTLWDAQDMPEFRQLPGQRILVSQQPMSEVEFVQFKTKLVQQLTLVDSLPYEQVITRIEQLNAERKVVETGYVAGTAVAAGSKARDPHPAGV